MLGNGFNEMYNKSILLLTGDFKKDDLFKKISRAVIIERCSKSFQTEAIDWNTVLPLSKIENNIKENK